MKSERDPIWGPPLRDVAVKCRKKLKAVRQTVGKNSELDAAAAAIEKDLDQGGLIAAQSGHAILGIGYLAAIADLNQTDLATLEVGLMSSKSPRQALANTIRASVVARELSTIQRVEEGETAAEALKKIDADLDAADYHLRQSERLAKRAARRMRELERGRRQ